MTKSKPPRVTNITPGDKPPLTDILSLHFDIPVQAEAEATVTVSGGVEPGASGATEASSGGTV